MPDIQTEMQKILRTWEEPYPQSETTEQPKGTKLFTPTSNTSRATFNMVRDNHGTPKKEIVRKLTTAGFKPASTSSLLSQMIRQGQVWVDSSGGLHPNQQEYTPLKPAKTFAKQTKTFKVKTSTPHKKYKVKDVPVPKGIAALVEEHKAKDEVQHIMDTISLPDAKRLHKALNEYFGSV